MSPQSSAATTTRLERLDVAFGRLRRLWESPALKRRFMARMGTTVEPGVVRTLRAVGECGASGGVGDVAAALAVDASTASRLVEQAVALGFLERATSPQDRRRTVLSLTSDGADILARATSVREELLSELTEDWSDRDVESLARLLERLAQRVGELES
jgi:DNA-binding MarR family transcriptional regulator